jgi:hypothetical protein
VEKVKNEKIMLTKVSILHYIRLVYRSALFLTALISYIMERIRQGSFSIDYQSLLVNLIWIIFAVEMVFRFFPSSLESPGCQKQFAKNYIKSGNTEIQVQDNHATMLIALIWICLNAIIGAFYMSGIFDDGIMILLCCAYSVCDLICILFFCPFQTWFMKNKCCSSCRIYNWDYAMMFTPLFFVRNFYSWSLLAMAMILMIRWEITFYLHPERFSERTNDYLKCAGCSEKLCTHKKQLKGLWEQIAAFTAERTKMLRK